MADDETIVKEIDFTVDPDKVIRETITPKALRRLYESLDSSNAAVLDKAIDKAIKIDKRIREKDAIPAPNQSLTVLAFNPEHLREVLGGIRGMFNGAGSVEPVRLAGREGESVDGEGVGHD